MEAAGEGGLKFHHFGDNERRGEEWGQQMSYVIPKLLCNSCPCQEGGDNSPRRFRKMETAGERKRGGRGVQLDESLYCRDCKFNQHTSEEFI